MNVSESVKAILASDQVVGHTFYQVFLEKYPEVQQHFHGVNMTRQGALLTTALIIVEAMHNSPHPAVEEYLRYLGSKHEKLSIPQEQYAMWTHAMLEALRLFHGADWNDSLASEWELAISKAINCMLSGYGQPAQI